MEDERCIYVILVNLGSAYFFFVSIFHFTRKLLWASYTPLSLENFCDSLIRAQDKLLHLGVIKTIGTSKKALVAKKMINQSIQKRNILATKRKTMVLHLLN